MMMATTPPMMAAKVPCEFSAEGGVIVDGGCPLVMIVIDGGCPLVMIVDVFNPSWTVKVYDLSSTSNILIPSLVVYHTVGT